MQDDRAELERVNTEIARYEADLSVRGSAYGREEEPRVISASQRIISGFLYLVYGFCALMVMVPAIGGLVHDKDIIALIVIGTLSSSFIYGVIRARPLTGTEDAASRQLDEREANLRANRRRLVEQQRDRLIAERDRLVEKVESQMGGGLSMSEDKEQRGELTTVSEE